jgi:hypothetical protein
MFRVRVTFDNEGSDSLDIKITVHIGKTYAAYSVGGSGVNSGRFTMLGSRDTNSEPQFSRICTKNLHFQTKKTSIYILRIKYQNVFKYMENPLIFEQF